MYQALPMSIVLLPFKSITWQKKLMVGLMSLMCDVESVYCKKKSFTKRQRPHRASSPAEGVRKLKER